MRYKKKIGEWAINTNIIMQRIKYGKKEKIKYFYLIY